MVHISVDFLDFLGAELPPGYHALWKMYETQGTTFEGLRVYILIII